MVKAYIEASYVCDHCQTRLVMVGVGSDTAARKCARKNGWTVGSELVICPECKKNPERLVYRCGEDIVVTA